MRSILKSLFSIALASLFLSTSPLIAQDATKPPGTGAIPQSAFKNVDVAQFDKIRAETNSVVLDVRTKKEFEAGHIPGAVNIDINSDDFEERVAKLDKSKSYLVYCAVGRRSVRACDRLAPLRFNQLYNLEGGFTAWEKAGKPGEK